MKRMAAPEATSGPASAPGEDFPGPATKTGKADMRFKENREWASQTASRDSAPASRQSAPPEKAADTDQKEADRNPAHAPAEDGPLLLLCYDLETTGLFGAQIVQIAAFMIRVHRDGQVERVGDMFLEHIMPSKAIDPGASKVHLIRMSEDGKTMIGRNGQDLKARDVADVLADLIEYIKRYNPNTQPYAMFGYNNIRFDDPVLRNEFKRAGMGTAALEEVGLCGSVDLLVAIRKHAELKVRFPRGSRKLTDVYAGILGKDLDLAHDASGDVEGVMQVMENDVPLTLGLLLQPMADFPVVAAQPRPKKTEPGETLVTFGKHRDLTFQQLKEQQPGYCAWVLDQGSASPAMRQLQDYLGKPPKQTDAVLDFGKHKGRTYSDVEAKEKGYCVWVLSQENPGGGLRRFQAYLCQKQEAGVLEGMAKLAV